jgi:hypothetical protein
LISCAALFSAASYLRTPHKVLKFLNAIVSLGKLVELDGDVTIEVFHKIRYYYGDRNYAKRMG